MVVIWYSGNPSFFTTFEVYTARTLVLVVNVVDAAVAGVCLPSLDLASLLAPPFPRAPALPLPPRKVRLRRTASDVVDSVRIGISGWRERITYMLPVTKTGS